MKKIALPDVSRCVACGACVAVCPKGAISVFRGSFAKVDATKCAGCLLCAAVCPAGVISGVEA